jgi:lysophospholipase L1-like esterase
VKSTTGRATALALIVAGMLLAAPGTVGAAASHAHWVAAWTAPMTGSSTGGPANATVRNIARVTLGGTRVRIRLSNPLSTDTSLVVGAAYVAIQKPDAAVSAQLVPGTNRRLTFSGKPGVTIPPKTDFVYSDPVDLPVKAQQNVAVSLYLPAATEPGASAATWNSSYTTSNGAGDKTREEDGSSFSAPSPSNVGGHQEPLMCAGCTTYALTAVDVFTKQANGAVIGLGSSTFHGYNSDQNGFDSVLNDLSVRVNKELPSGQQKSVISAGIGGDTLHAALTRIRRDVYGQTDVTGVVLYDVNDIAPNGGSRTADQIEDDYRKVIADSHARNIRVFCSTWPPESTDLSPSATNERNKLNAWILNSGACDDIVDWDRVLRDPHAPETYFPDYYSDSIHPNAAGHKAMADAVPLRWFRLANLAPNATVPCVDRRKFKFHIHQPRDGRVVDVKAYVNGKLVKHLRAHRVQRLVLRRLPKGIFTIKIVATTTNHTRTVSTRRYRGCRKGRPHTDVIRG